MRQPVIVAGDVTDGVWCPPCQAPLRIRVPLHIGGAGRPAVTYLDFCASCGTGYMPARPAVAEAVRAPGSWRPRPVLAALWGAHRWSSKRAGRAPRACAYRACERPGWHDCAFLAPADLGRVRYVFCGRRHRAAWARQQVRGGGHAA